ncbi:MAG: amidohydrolase family protein [Ilumatobacteraceae bacterium]
MTRLLIRGGIVVDGIGHEPHPADVVLEAGRIVAVGPGLDGDTEIDATGHTVYPGFIDCHVHFMADGNLDPMLGVQTPFSLNFFLAAERMARTLATGVTTVREAGGSDLGVKAAQQRGLAPGPDMQISIAILSQTGGHGDSWQPCGAHLPGLIGLAHPGKPDNIVDGPEAMRKKVRELVRAGADVIKVCTSGGVLSPRDDPRHGHFRNDELEVLVAEATAAGKWVMAHAQATDGIKSAIRAGIRSIEHGIYLDDEAIAMMLEHGTYLVPTLIAPMGVLEAVDRGVNVPQYAIDKTRMVIETHRDSIGRAIAAGVKVAMGTDSGVTPHGQNLRELEQMIACGMSPAGAVTAATRTAAQLMGLADDRGSLEPGKRADLVITRGLPFDLTDLRSRIRWVVQAGALVIANP